MCSQISGPIAPYSNVPINTTYYTPKTFTISNITLNGENITVTTIDHEFAVGTLVRLHIPKLYGSFQLNEKQGYISTVDSSTQVTIEIPSYNVNAYISAPSNSTDLPQISAIGDVNTGGINTGRSNQQLYIAGSFRNISP